MNHPTLKRLVEVNPNILIYIPAFDSLSCKHTLEQLGFKNIQIPDFLTWVSLNEDAQMMILPDAAGRDDSGLLVEYKGHRILNTVDCSNLNDGILPKVDLLMASFAGGASGYPICWSELYSDEFIRARIEQNRKTITASLHQQIQESRPRVFMPFAGYFTESYPSDTAILAKNIKNSAINIQAILSQRFSRLKFWLPSAGEMMDLANDKTFNNTDGKLQDYALFDFASHTREIYSAQAFEPLDDLKGIEVYFQWAGYHGNVVLDVIETDESFNTTAREFLYDFGIGSIIPERPERDHEYLRMRVRSDVFRYVLKEGLPWEDISIGFQARFYREPDIYNLDFWNHFQNKLPAHKPFLESIVAH